ncbi:MAG: hypothetical protein PGN24_00745 [Microbacterium arborescens]
MTTDSPRTRPSDEEYDKIRDLVSRSALESIEFHDYHARRVDENMQRQDDEQSVDVSMVLQRHFSEDSFGVRLVARLHPYMGEIVVAVAAEYSISHGGQPDEVTVRGFGNEVAVMTLLPYAREAVSTLSTRVFGKPILLPTIERGEVGFDLDEIASVTAS